jgi:hypothetical protein
VGASLVGVLAIEGYGLTSGTLGLVAIGAVLAIALSVIVLAGRARWAALGAALACAFTLTWNGWFVGPVRPGDVLILITLLLLAVAEPRRAFRMPPWWISQLALAIIVIALIAIYFPADTTYLLSRTVLDAQGRPTVDTHGPIWRAIVGVAFKFVVGVFATPVAFTGATVLDRRAARWLGIAFATGTALSGWAATADHFGGNVGHIITGLPNIGSRQVGFAWQPNFLAAGVVLAMPFAFWLLASAIRWERLIGLACLIGLVGGVYSSGSRGGAACTVVVLALCILIHPRTRPHAAAIVVAVGIVVVVAGGLIPSLGHEILKTTRLAGGVRTAGSDTVRAIVGAQGVRDFEHYPIAGIGLQASFDASEVYLQELASGGLILFLAMQTYMLGGIVAAWRYLKRYDMAFAVLISLVATLGLNLFEADLTDRFYYVPAAILAAMMHTLRGEPGGDADADVGERVPALPSSTSARGQT